MMQTFVPYTSFVDSAKVLDRQRLGKQRVETMQILKALAGFGGWQDHPATKMWAGYETALMHYQVAVCREWTGRGYKDTCLDKSKKIYRWFARDFTDLEYPEWWGSSIHITHRSNLVRKDPDHYRQFFPDVPDNIDYYWPI